MDEREGLRPVPDPTVLTTEALHREIAGLKELLQTQARCDREVVQAGINEFLNRLSRIEEHRREHKQDTKEAVDAALLTQKEAAGKAEVANAKIVEGLQSQLDTAVESLRREQGDLKDRVTVAEGIKTGGQQNLTGVYAFIGAIGLLIVIAIAIANVLSAG